MSNDPQDYQRAIIPALWCLHTVLEYWLGKTDKVQSNSVLELIWNWIKPRRKNG